MPYYNYRTGFIENNNEAYLTHAEALRNKWKCDKYSAKFQNYRLVQEHQTQFHSYQMCGVQRPGKVIVVLYTDRIIKVYFPKLIKQERAKVQKWGQTMSRNVLTKTFKCDCCEFVWRPTLWLLPKTYPKCKSPYWDTHRKKQ